MPELLTEKQIEFLCLPILQGLTKTIGAVDAELIVDKINSTFLLPEDQQYAYNYILNTLLEQKV